MTVDEKAQLLLTFQEMVRQNAGDTTGGDLHESSWHALYAGLGLTGEAGEVAELVKLVKKSARKNAAPLDRVKLVMELSDVLWYTTRVAQLFNLSLEQVLDAGVAKMTSRRFLGKNDGVEYDLVKQRRADFDWV